MPDTGERRTMPIELLWDLVFVFAVTRVSALLGADLSWAGFGRAALALALVWWAWSAFAWASNAQDPGAAFFRFVLLLATGLIFIAGLALPRAFAGDGTLFAVTYACVRFLHLALYVHASRQGKASLASIAGFAVTVTIGMALLIGERYGLFVLICLPVLFAALGTVAAWGAIGILALALGVLIAAELFIEGEGADLAR